MLHIELKIIVNIPIGTTQQKTSVPPLFQKNKYDTQCFTLNASRDCFSDGSLSNGSELEGHRHRHGNSEFGQAEGARRRIGADRSRVRKGLGEDRKSTRLNSSHYCASRMPTSACNTKPILKEKQK